MVVGLLEQTLYLIIYGIPFLPKKYRLMLETLVYEFFSLLESGEGYTKTEALRQAIKITRWKYRTPE